MQLSIDQIQAAKRVLRTLKTLEKKHSGREVTAHHNALAKLRDLFEPLLGNGDFAAMGGGVDKENENDR